jgi:hypothetical protein
VTDEPTAPDIEPDSGPEAHRTDHRVKTVFPWVLPSHIARKASLASSIGRI